MAPGKAAEILISNGIILDRIADRQAKIPGDSFKLETQICLDRIQKEIRPAKIRNEKEV